MFNWIAQEDVLALQREEAILAGENARIQLELEEAEGETVVRNSMRRRLARTLVQLGMRIDPLVGDESEDGD